MCQILQHGRFRWLILLLCWGYLPGTGQAADWQQVRSEAGVELYQRPAAESDLRWLLATTRLHAPPAALLALLLDLEQLSRWVADYRQVRILEREGVESFLVYIRIDAPFLMLDRDGIIASAVSWQGGVLRIGNRLDLSGYQPRPDTVPLRALSGCWDVQPEPDGVVVIRYRGLTDPAAEPTWLARVFSSEALFQTFVGLRVELARPKYHQEGRVLESRYRERLQRLPIPDDCLPESD